PCGPLDDRLQFPGQVVHVLNARVPAKATGWWHEMRAIADEEHSSLAVTVGEGGGGGPGGGGRGGGVDDVNPQMRLPGAPTCQLPITVGGEVFDTFAAFRHELNGHQP